VAQVTTTPGDAAAQAGGDDLFYRLGLSLAGILTFIAGWALAAHLEIAPPNFLPDPFAVLRKLIELTQQPYSGSLLQQHLIASLDKFALSYVLAAAIGVPLGLTMGRFRTIDWAVSPVFEALRFIPPIAWVPFSILWFGTGFLAPTLVIFAGAFSPCVVNSYRGAKLIDRPLLEAAQTLGAGRVQTIAEILLPAALPHIVAGLRVGAGFGWQSLIGAELIVGATGLGYMIVQGESNLNADVVIAGMMTIGVVGATIDYLMRAAESRVRRKWGQAEASV
jgi:ABC-type nitrate/sulfonate/bicarbonate transport system permease component